MGWNFTTSINIGDRNEQQDRVEILHSENNTHLLVLADGMGGHEDGALAAQTVIDVATRHFNDNNFSNPGEALENICLDAHLSILMLSTSSSSPPGSTCVLLYLTETEAYWVHVGDSRLYQFSHKQCMYKTTDHSINQLKEIQNNSSEQDASSQNQLYMCLGGSNDVTPESMAVSVNPGDQFLLCSDGLWDQLDLEVSLEKSDAVFDQSFADQLVKSSWQSGEGKSDNISLAWACFQVSAEEKKGWLASLLNWFQGKNS